MLAYRAAPMAEGVGLGMREPMLGRDREEIGELFHRRDDIPQATLERLLHARQDLRERVGVTNPAPECGKVLPDNDDQGAGAIRARDAGLDLHSVGWKRLRNREQHESPDGK